MTKVRRDQVMLAAEQIARGASQRAMAAQLGVSEGTLRYRLRRVASGVADRRRERPSVLDSYTEAVTAVLAALVDPRRPERPVAGRLVYEALVRDYDFAGSYPALIRYLRKRRGVPPIRALRRVETPPGMQAQHDWFTERVVVDGEAAPL